MTRMIFFKKRKALLINEDTVKQLQEFNGIGHGRFAQILAGSRMTEPFEKKLALTYEKHMTELRYPKKNECLAFYFSKIEGPTSFETRNRYSLFKVSLDYNIEVEEISVLHFAPDKTLPKKGQGCLQLLPHAKFNFAEQDKGFIHRHFFVDRWEDGTLLKENLFGYVSSKIMTADGKQEMHYLASAMGAKHARLKFEATILKRKEI